MAAEWNSELAAVRRVIFEGFAARGAAPSPRRIAAEVGEDVETVLARLRALHGLHQIVLEVEGDAIRMAHPFSAAPMGFVLSASDGRMWWGGCAWDSFGIVAALGEPLEIATLCPSSGRQIAFVAGPQTPPPAALTVRLPRPAAEWWNNVVETCSNIRLFCDEDHASRYVAREGLPEGALVPARDMWELALAWYGDRLDPGYAPSSPEERQATLARLGFRGAFWKLP